jgi:spermidine synthase
MKKLLSYLFPFVLKHYTSSINGRLTINLVNGKKILDTPRSNYSYGALQKVLHKGLAELPFTSDISSILVLGLGGGSIVPTIREDFNSSAFMELVDMDAEIISIAKNEFAIEQFGNINIVHSDALEYIKNTTHTFDLIIVDLFIVDTIPEVFTQPEFIDHVVYHLAPNGKLIYNTMRKTLPIEVFNRIKESLLAKDLSVKILQQVEWSNDLIIAYQNAQ